MRLSSNTAPLLTRGLREVRESADLVLTLFLWQKNCLNRTVTPKQHIYGAVKQVYSGMG